MGNTTMRKQPQHKNTGHKYQGWHCSHNLVANRIQQFVATSLPSRDPQGGLRKYRMWHGTNIGPLTAARLQPLAGGQRRVEGLENAQWASHRGRCLRPTQTEPHMKTNVSAGSHTFRQSAHQPHCTPTHSWQAIHTQALVHLHLFHEGLPTCCSPSRPAHPVQPRTHAGCWRGYSGPTS